MNIERYISLFDKKSAKLLKEVNISYISLENLVKIFGYHENDPFFYMVYNINKKKLSKLNKYLKEYIPSDTRNVIYTLDCFKAP